MSDNNVHSGGIGFCGLLTICFIVLRLTGFIDWEWWWVLAPMWVPVAFALLVFVVVVIYYAIVDE